MRRRLFSLMLGLLLALALISCSPEDGRARGGGHGADIGNTRPDFKPASKVFTSTYDLEP